MPDVEIPDVGTVQFPDEMSQADIVTAIEKDILPNHRAEQAARDPAQFQERDTAGASQGKSFMDQLAETLGASSAEVGRSANSELAAGVAQGIGDMIPKTPKDAAITAGLIGLTVVAPEIGLPVVGVLGAKGYGESLAELEQATRAGDVQGASRAFAKGVLTAGMMAEGARTPGVIKARQARKTPQTDQAGAEAKFEVLPAEPASANRQVQGREMPTVEVQAARVSEAVPEARQLPEPLSQTSVPETGLEPGVPDRTSSDLGGPMTVDLTAQPELVSPIKQAPEPASFPDVASALNFRETRMAEERALYKDQIGLTDPEAQRLQTILARDGSTTRFERDIGPEKAAKLNDFFEGPWNQKSAPFKSWEYDKTFDPTNLEAEDSVPALAQSLINVVERLSPEDVTSPSNDRFLFANIAARKFAELGGTLKDLAVALDRYTTRISGSAGDKAETFTVLSDKLGSFFKSQGVDLAGVAKAQPNPAPSLAPETEAAAAQTKQIADLIKSTKAEQAKLRANIEAAQAEMAGAKAGPEPGPSPAEPSPAPAEPNRAIPSDSPQALGITPQASAPVVEAATALGRLRQGVVEQFQLAKTKDQLSGLADAVENKANILARQQANEVRLDVLGKTMPSNKTVQGLLFDKFTKAEQMDLEALTPIVEAGGDIAKLQEAAAKVIGSNKAEPAMKRVYDHALRNFDRLEPKAAGVSEKFQAQLESERASGMEVDSVENYVTHRYDFDTMLGPGRPVILDASGGRGMGGSSFFKKQRVFDTYADAIAEGYKPRNMDVAALLEHRVRAGQTAMNARSWVDAMREMDSPVTGRPLIADYVTQPKGTKVLPMGYQPVNIAPGISVGVEETLAPLIGRLTSREGLPGLMAPVAKYASAAKHVLLAIDTFHVGRVMSKAAGWRQFGHKLGRSALEYSDQALDQAVKAGELSPEMASKVREIRPELELGIQQGLNVGKISDALYNDVVRHVPGVHKFTKWVFDKMSRGVMAQSYVWALRRNAKLYPELSKVELARKTAKEVNEYYGNLGKQGILKSKKEQDLARLLFLAPSWVEGLVRNEASAYKQVGQAVAGVAKGQGYKLGNQATGIGTTVLAFFLANQLINRFTKGGFTWETNPEEHKFDAFVPDTLEGSAGYWMSPLGTAAEISHDLSKFTKDEQGAAAGAARLLSNKTSPVYRAGYAALAGKTLGMGTPLVDTEDRLKQAGKELLPVPIGVSAFQNSYIGSKQRQLFSSVGLKLDKVVEDFKQEKIDNAKDFNRMDQVVQAAMAEIRKNPDDQGKWEDWAEAKLEGVSPKLQRRALAEIRSRSKKIETR